jgi:hypothetical protein
MESAYDFLEQGRVRALNTDIEKKLSRNRLTIAIHQDSKPSKSKIQNQNSASFYASPASPPSAAVAPAASSEPALEFQNCIRTRDATPASLGAFAALLENTEPQRARRGRKPSIPSIRPATQTTASSSDSSQLLFSLGSASAR